MSPRADVPTLLSPREGLLAFVLLAFVLLTFVLLTFVLVTFVLLTFSPSRLPTFPPSDL